MIAIAKEGRAAVLAQPAHGGLQTRSFSSWAEFDAIAPDWDRLSARANGSVFSSAAWIRAWRDTYPKGAAPRIVTLWDDAAMVAGAALGLAPLPVAPQIKAHRPPALQMLSCEFIGSLEWLYVEDCYFAPLLEAVVELPGWRWACFDHLRNDRHLEGIKAAAPRLGLVARVKPRYQCTTIDLSAGWDTYLNGRSPSFRRNLRAAERKLAAEPHRFVSLADGGDEVLERALELGRRSWKANPANDPAVMAQRESLLRHLWRELKPLGAMQLWLLEVGGETIASNLVLEWNHCGFGLVSDFDEKFAHLSPGRIMMSRYLQEAPARGISMADFLRRTHHLQMFSESYFETSQIVLLRRLSAERAIFDGAAWLRDSARALGRTSAARMRRKDLKPPEQP